MWKYVLGFTAGVVLTNAWQALPLVQVERHRQADSSVVVVERLVEVVSESLMVFEPGVVYRVVQNVGRDAPVKFEVEWNRFDEKRLWSHRPELKKMTTGTRFYLSYDRTHFVVLGQGSV